MSVTLFAGPAGAEKFPLVPMPQVAFGMPGGATDPFGPNGAFQRMGVSAPPAGFKDYYVTGLPPQERVALAGNLGKTHDSDHIREGTWLLIADAALHEPENFAEGLRAEAARTGDDKRVASIDSLRGRLARLGEKLEGLDGKAIVGFASWRRGIQENDEAADDALRAEFKQLTQEVAGLDWQAYVIPGRADGRARRVATGLKGLVLKCYGFKSAEADPARQIVWAIMAYVQKVNHQNRTRPESDDWRRLYEGETFLLPPEVGGAKRDLKVCP